MTEEQFTQATQQAFNPTALDICSGWKGNMDVEGKIHDVFFQIYAVKEEGYKVLEASTYSRLVKILQNEDIDQFLGILFAKISEEQGYETALEWANSINLETLYEWFQTAEDLFNGKIKMNLTW